MSFFQDWLSSSFKPCALVYCTEQAKSIIAKNNLTPSEFLRPFGDFRGKKIQIHFNEKEKEKEKEKDISIINNFILDFYDNDKFQQVETESIINYVITCLKANEPTWNLSSPLITKGYAEPFLNRLKHYSTPWFREFEKTLLECLHFDEYELYQQPLINIFICSIEEKTSVINDNLCKQTPKLILNKRYQSPKESIIITLNDCKDHNLKEEELEKCKSRFSSMFKTYYIINWDINCPPYSEPNIGDQKKISDNFKKCFHRTDIYNKDDENYKDYKNKQYGMYINYRCYKKYKEDFFQYFSTDFINKIPKQISSLNETIKKNTGFSKIFKKSNEITYYRDSKVYKFTEVERAYYNLGLIYFFFQNYDLANDTFKLLRNTLREKSDKHKERIKEIKAICKILEKKESKKEYNILEEFNVQGTNEQKIRTEIIIIKIMENRIKTGKDNNYKLLIDIIAYFLKKAGKLLSKNTPLAPLDYFYPLLQEKIGVYYLLENKFRKYVFYLSYAGRYFAKITPQLKQYALFCLSNLVYFIDNPSPSFTKLRIYFNKLLGEVCNSLKYCEGSLKFYKNCLDFSCIIGNDSKETQNSFLNYYLSILTQIKRDKIICNNIDLTDLNIPYVDNASLFVLENDDYNIKQKAKKILGTDEKSWLVFNKYGESLITDVYANLDDIDLDHIKLIHDLTNQTNKVIANVHTDRYFYGNINQKLFVKCTIRNPLSIEIQITSVKLYCQFIPQNKSSNKQSHNFESNTPNPDYINKNENQINITNNSQKEIKDNNCNNENDTDNKNSIDINININEKLKSLNINNNINEKNTETPHLSYSISEDSYNMQPGETIELELNVSSPIEGKIIVKGLEFLLFSECKIIHLFSKKTTPSLYYYVKKKNIYNMGGSSNESYSDFDSRNSSEFVKRLNLNNFVIPRKNKIEYIISDFKDDLFVTFPMGTKVTVFLYQLFFFPIEVNNNSIQQRVRRYTIFIEDCNKNKVKTFFNYITRDNNIKQRFTSETVLIPIIPLATGKIYIKILIKFSGEMRVKPIQVKRFLIKLKVKESISFEVKEYCSNLKIDKEGKTYNKMDFNIKTNLRIRNEKEFKNIVMKEPVFNKELNLLSQKHYLITNNEIHKKFVFIKENIPHNDIVKYDLDFIAKNINKEDKENENTKQINDITIKRTSNNNFIIDKFNKILNNPNGNIIFFPWEATNVIINENNNNENKDNSNNETPNNECNSPPKEVILQGLYPYKLKMENSEATKTLLTYLFNKYTELNITQKKIDKEKTLIKMILTLNKIGLASMGDKIEKYEIYAHPIRSQIIWLGPKNFVVKNNIDEKSFTCRFSYITTLKGLIEINRISVLVYKKPEKKGEKTSIIELNHITKPNSIFIE